MKKFKFGLIEDKGDEIFLNLGQFETFEEALRVKKTSAIFRDIKKLIIVQRVEE